MVNFRAVFKYHRLTLIKLEKDITIPPRKKNIRDFFEEGFHTRSIGRGAGKLIAGAGKTVSE